MKIAFLTEIPTPYRDPLFDQVAKLRGFEFEVLYSLAIDHERNWNWVEKGFPHKILAEYRVARTSNPLDAIRFCVRIWKLLSASSYAAIIVGGYVQLEMLLTILWCMWHHKPYILHSESQHLTRRPVLTRIMKWPLVTVVIKAASGYLVMGSKARDYVISYGANPRNVFYFPNTPDIHLLVSQRCALGGERQNLRAALGLQGDMILLFVGRLVAEKNIEVLLRAFELLQREMPSVGLTIVGDGILRCDLEKLASDLKLQNVRFTGFVHNSELHKYYIAADVFVLPSRHEPWGVVVLEAMACGLPIVASEKVGSAHDLVVDNDNGFQVPFDEPAAFANALRSILKDGPSREEMGKRSLERVSRWDYDLCIKSIRKVISAAVPSLRGEQGLAENDS